MNARVHNTYSTDVTAALGYLVAPKQKPRNYMFDPPAGQPRENCEYEWRDCRIHDARQLTSAVGLDTTGFELFYAASTVSDFRDPQQVTKRYYREVEEVAKSITGGTCAVVFDHLVRRREEGRPQLSFGRQGDGSNAAAVGRVHNDYSEKSGRARLDMVLPDMPQEHPFLILNLWRPIVHPVFDTPLAVCDARSFAAGDRIASDIIYPDRTGEIYLAKYSPAHAWYYYPLMMPDELLVFKQYDSRLDNPVRMTPHCAFDHPDTAADSPLRQSIEIRCLVILE